MILLKRNLLALILLSVLLCFSTTILASAADDDLVTAAGKGRAAFVSDLLKANDYEQEELNAALIAGVKKGNAKIVQDLLEAGALAPIDLKKFRNQHLSPANAIRREALSKLNDEDGEFSAAINYFNKTADKFGEDRPERWRRPVYAPSRWG